MKKRTKFMALIMACVMLMSAFLTGCGGNGTNEDSEQKNVKIV